MNAALSQAISGPTIASCYINHPFHHQHLSFFLLQAQPPVCPYILDVEKILRVQSPGCIMKRLRSREARKLIWCGTAGEDFIIWLLSQDLIWLGGNSHGSDSKPSSILLNVSGSEI